jgi:hypothetical protein
MQLGQATNSGLSVGARKRFRAARSRAISWSTTSAEELPQQFQSVSSIRFTPSFRHVSIKDRLFSWAVVANEQPGK